MTKFWKIFVVITFCIAVAGLYSPAFNDRQQAILNKKIDERLKSEKPKQTIDEFMASRDSSKTNP